VLVFYVIGFLLGVKQPGHDADHSCLSSAEVKHEYSYACTLALCQHGVDKEHFTYYVLYQRFPLSPYVCDCHY